MKNFTTKILILFCLFVIVPLNAQINNDILKNTTDDKVQALKDLLVEMQTQTDNSLFINYCKSFINVIDAQTSLSSRDINFLSSTYDKFIDTSDQASLQKLSSYLERKRTMVMAWQSPTDGETSFSLLKFPKNWKPNTAYPVYIELHGLWSVADSPIEFMTYYFLNGPSSTYAFEDGYLLSPWGRGNYWYQGISETDIWECKAELERLVKIDPKREYICGHSMGGFGALYFATQSPQTWAALGVHAGALQYNGESLVQYDVLQNIKNLPTYFVVGTKDGLMGIDQRTYNMLNEIGNVNTEFVTFNGGHEYVISNVENMYDWMKEFTNNNDSNIPKVKTSGNEKFFCFPNPISQSTTIKFNLTRSSYVNISIYDLNGLLVETILEDALFLGFHELKYNPTGLTNGMYFCKLESKYDNYIFKMLISK